MADNGLITVYGEPELTFINSGNRPAAITSITAIISRLDSIAVESPKCATTDKLDYLPAPLNIEPFVLKPGEIIVRTGGFAKPFFDKKHDFYVLRVPIPKVKKGDAFLACLQLSITPPDSHSAKTQLPAYQVRNWHGSTRGKRVGAAV